MNEVKEILTEKLCPRLDFTGDKCGDCHYFGSVTIEPCNNPLLFEVLVLISEARKEERERIIKCLWECSTAISAPNPWKIITFTFTKEEWDKLSKGVSLTKEGGGE